MKNYDSAGLANGFWGFIDPTSGRFLGAATTLANAADSGAVEIAGLESAEINPEAPRIVTTQGNNGPISNFIFPPASNPQGTLTVGIFNSNLYALPTGGKVYALDSDHELVMIQPSDVDYKNVCVIINSNAKAQDSGSVGLAGYMVEIYPRCQLVPSGGSARSNSQPSNYTHSIIANRFDKFPWGESLSASNQGTTGAVGFRFYSPYPCTMHAHRGDASDVAFTLAKTPAASDAVKIGVWNTSGSKLSYTSGFTVSGKVITLAAAPAAAADTTTLYEYDPTA